MFSPAHLPHPTVLPANTQFHVRVQLRLTRRHLPYLRPVVVLTTRGGARL